MSVKEFAFHPTGDTVLLASATTAPTGVQVVSNDAQGANRSSDCYQFYNAGDETSYIGWGATAASAQSATVVPTLGTAQGVVPVPAGAVIVFRFGLNMFFSGINATSAGDVFITPGEGV